MIQPILPSTTSWPNDINNPIPMTPAHHKPIPRACPPSSKENQSRSCQNQNHPPTNPCGALDPTQSMQLIGIIQSSIGDVRTSTCAQSPAKLVRRLKNVEVHPSGSQYDQGKRGDCPPSVLSPWASSRRRATNKGPCRYSRRPHGTKKKRPPMRPRHPQQSFTPSTLQEKSDQARAMRQEFRLPTHRLTHQIGRKAKAAPATSPLPHRRPNDQPATAVNHNCNRMDQL